MNNTDYELAVQRLTETRHEIVNAKRPAYTASDIDVLINFKRGAEAAGVRPLQAWWILFHKHMEAIRSRVKNPDGKQAEPMIGRFADAINYLELGYALMVEEEQIATLQTPKIEPHFKSESCPLQGYTHGSAWHTRFTFEPSSAASPNLCLYCGLHRNMHRGNAT